MWVILDGDAGNRQVFGRPRHVIEATHPEQVPQALAELSQAAAQGLHAAGWLAYELGYALEPRLAPLLPKPLQSPLLKFGLYDAPQPAVPAAPGRAYAGALVPDWSATDYAARFARVHDYIEAGDIYQANLSFRAGFAFAGDALALYEQLRAAADAHYCAYVDDGERQILSISPELFFQRFTDGRIISRPMKGTAWRSADPADDVPARAALAASAKNRAENLMIVDLIRNDLGRVARTGSVHVPGLFEVETYPTLHTMVSTVEATLRPEADFAALLAALFPCGSVTGAPKIRAMEILRELEASPRGPYCGAVGHIAPDGSARFNVAIRTLAIEGGRGSLGLGGGVVQDSRAADEYAECLLKARFFESVRRPLELIETLRYEDGRFLRLESHLERLAASARVFGLRYDPAQAQAALQAAVSRSSAPQRVRLSLDEVGVHRAVATALPPNPPQWRAAISAHRIQSGDLLLRHKTSWRELYEDELACLATDEVIFLNERGEVAEGARSNVFVRKDGLLLTPPQSCGLLDGRLRAELLAQGRAREAVLRTQDLQGELWFGNSLRGLIRGTLVVS